MTATITDLMQWMLPCGGIGAAVAWIANRNARNMKNSTQPCATSRQSTTARVVRSTVFRGLSRPYRYVLIAILALLAVSCRSTRTASAAREDKVHARTQSVREDSSASRTLSAEASQTRATVIDTTDWLTWTEELRIGDTLVPVVRARRIARRTEQTESRSSSSASTQETSLRRDASKADSLSSSMSKDKKVRTESVTPTFCIWLSVFAVLAMCGVATAVILSIKNH